MKFQWIVVVLVPAILIGCGGGGGGGTPAVEYKMADVAAPKNAGTEGGFIYDTTNRQTVAVDIRLPYQFGSVSIYDSRPLVSFDSSGAPISTPSLLLDQGTGGHGYRWWSVSIQRYYFDLRDGHQLIYSANDGTVSEQHYNTNY